MLRRPFRYKLGEDERPDNSIGTETACDIRTPMLFSTALAVFLISWSSLFLLDYVLRLKNYTPYVEFANRHGLEISPFQCRLYTSRMEGPEPPSGLLKPGGGAIRRTLYSIWFGFGALVSLVCLVMITAYLSRLLYSDISQLAAYRPKVTSYRAMPIPTPAEPQEPLDDLPPPPPEEYDILDGGQRGDDGLVPIIPGINLPWGHIPIFMVVLIIAAVFHELGHSQAAENCGVKVNGFGIFVFALYPGAFTDIEPVSLKRATPFSRLMIFGGGIWHNMILAGFAYLLFLATPLALTPFFSDSNGVTVTAVNPQSGLYGPAGLSPGHVVEAIEGCAINRLEDWRGCVRQIEHQLNGRCIPRSVVEATKTDRASVAGDEVLCCDSFQNITHAHMCFEAEVMIISSQVSSKAPNPRTELLSGLLRRQREAVVKERRELAKQFSCLSARYVTDQPICNRSADGACDEIDPIDPRICLFPALYNGTQLARITVRDLNRPVLYVGNLDELISFVSVSGLTVRWDMIPFELSEAVELIPKYLFTLSVALAALNAVPCYALDGQYIVITLVNWFCRSLPKRRRQQIIGLTLLFGTLLLTANIIIGFVKFSFA